MARPTKDGLEYFPLDCVFDDKWELLEAEHGAEGFRLVIKLWQLIYKDRGYFYPWTDKEQKLLSVRVSVDINSVRTIVEYAAKIDLFNYDLYHKGLLTSRGIQRRYVASTARRTSLVLYRDLLLIPEDSVPRLVGKNPRLVTFGEYFCEQKPQPDAQSKEKESKEKESKERETPSGSPVDNSKDEPTQYDIDNLNTAMKNLAERNVV